MAGESAKGLESAILLRNLRVFEERRGKMPVETKGRFGASFLVGEPGFF